jgi:putative colanic acid biosynthesis UDP-glucose lipid carrier transferase
MLWIQRLFNAVIIVSVLMTLAWLRDGAVLVHYRYMAIIAVLTTLIVYHYFGVYRRFENRIGGIQHLARAWGVVIIIIGWLGFATKTTEEYSRQVIFYWVVISFFLQCLIFPSIYWVYKKYQVKYGSQLISSLVIGTEEIAKHLTFSINRNIWLPDKVIGVVAVDHEEKQRWDSEITTLLGTLNELEYLISKHNIRRVYIALPLRLSHLIEKVQNTLFKYNIDIIWAPDIFSLSLLNPSVRELAGAPLITLSESPILAGGPAFLKIIMDKSIAFIAILFLSPLFIVIATIIKLTSPGPIIFKQKRHGWDGKIFKVWKFRSMHLHQTSSGKIEQASKNDPRFTPIGRFIRKTSIDELPQLFNVLQGTMSLVGPRPHAVEHNNYYSEKVTAYLSRHRIKPGITGLAQVNGFRGETDTLNKMEQRIAYDLEYINNWSPWLDIKILLKTPISLFTKDAY